MVIRPLCIRLMLGAAALLLGGCMVPGFFADAFSKKTIEPVFDLPDVPTLVLVDDPQVKFGSALVAAGIADRIMMQLRQREVVTQFIPLSEINDLKVELGDEYMTTSIDAVGKAVDADQVLYVLVEDVTRYPQPGVFMPKSHVTVKVIDVVNAKRVFPKADLDTRPRGYDLTADLGVMISEEVESGGEAAALRMLAERTARDVARLFHPYEPDSIGERSNATNILEF